MVENQKHSLESRASGRRRQHSRHLGRLCVPDRFRWPAQRSSARLLLSPSGWPAALAEPLFRNGPHRSICSRRHGRAHSGHRRQAPFHPVRDRGPPVPGLRRQAGVDSVPGPGIRAFPQSLGHGRLAHPADGLGHQVRRPDQQRALDQQESRRLSALPGFIQGPGLSRGRSGHQHLPGRGQGHSGMEKTLWGSILRLARGRGRQDLFSQQGRRCVCRQGRSEIRSPGQKRCWRRNRRLLGNLERPDLPARRKTSILHWPVRVLRAFWSAAFVAALDFQQWQFRLKNSKPRRTPHSKDIKAATNTALQTKEAFMSQDDEKLRARIMDAILELPRDQLLRLANIIAEENGERQLRPIAIQGIDEHAIPSQSDQSQSRDWPHAPVHRLSDHGTYLVTAGTLYKQHFFRSSERLDFLEGKLLQLARQYFWQLEAWAVFPNHYHFIAHSQPGSEPLNEFLRDLHAATALYLNRLEI